MTRAIVLVADDDRALRDMLTAFLQEKGYRVLPAATGQEALAHVAQASPRPDILLLDLLMPNLDGYAVLERLRQRADLDVPVLIFSAHRPDPSLLQALAGERRDFIPKPFDLEELHIRLQRLLRPTPARSPNQSQDAVRVYALGSLRVLQGDTCIMDESWRNKPARSLFKVLLAAHGERVPKEALIEALWPEADPAVATNRLRVAVHDLRQQARDASERGRGPDEVSPLIVQSEGTYTFDPDGQCWTDVRAFQEAMAQGQKMAAQDQRDAALAAYTQAVALYAGDYLRDDPFAEWAVDTRERLREAYLETLSALARLQAQQGNLDAAMQACRQILRLEPWREEIYRHLMRHLAAAGRPRAALRAFEECVRALAAEEAAPGPATQQVRARIMAVLQARCGEQRAEENA